MIRRLFAFLFRHDLDVDPNRVRILAGMSMTTLVCKRCGEAYEYPVFDRVTFSALYRMRGCKGARP